METITRIEAKRRGLKRFFTGVPCNYGHITERTVSSSGCLACNAVRTATARRANPEKLRAESRAHYWAAPAVHRTRARRWQKENPERAAISLQRFKVQNPQRVAASGSVARAKALGIQYDHAFLASLPCPAVCPALGTPIAFTRCKGVQPAENTASFDQIRPGGGYVKGNVRIISLLANVMLSNGTREQRIALAHWILRHEAD